jgi:hypothetical protein
MELNFIQSKVIFGKKTGYEAEFEATADFNIHIERKHAGGFLVYQKTVADGKYDAVDNVPYQRGSDVIDLDMTALVYPKYIKIVSESEVTMGVVTFA